MYGLRVGDILDTSINVLESVFKNTAPYDKGNLRYSMLSLPLVYGRVAIMEFGKDWEHRSKTKYNYGQLLNDKRIIKNREMDVKTNGKRDPNKIRKRDEIRAERAYKNARTLIVKDTRYGNTLVMSQRQYETNRQSNAIYNKNNPTNKRKDYEIIRVHYDKPVKASRPTRINKHYHYLDNFYDIYLGHLVNALNGTLHNGDYGVDKEDRELTRHFRQKIKETNNKEA